MLHWTPVDLPQRNVCFRYSRSSWLMRGQRSGDRFYRKLTVWLIGLWKRSVRESFPRRGRLPGRYLNLVIPPGKAFTPCCNVLFLRSRINNIIFFGHTFFPPAIAPDFHFSGFSPAWTLRISNEGLKQLRNVTGSLLDTLARFYEF